LEAQNARDGFSPAARGNPPAFGIGGDVGQPHTAAKKKTAREASESKTAVRGALFAAAGRHHSTRYEGAELKRASKITIAAKLL
jgi:hypothetical protein